MVFTNLSYDNLFYGHNDQYMEINQEKFLENKLYKYHSKHPENSLLSEIIMQNKLIYSVDYESFLYKCYQNLINKNLFDIIYEIIVGDNSNDELAIALAAIMCNNFDVMDMLTAKGFKTNQMLVENEKMSFLNSDLLTFATRENNYEMVKFMVEKGADPTYNNAMSLSISCSYGDSKIYEYFMEQNIPCKYFPKIFSTCCNNIIHSKNNNEHNYKKIKILFEKGLDINATAGHFLNYGVCNVEILQFLLDNGMNFDPKIFLLNACKHGNVELVDFLLKKESTVDSLILGTMLENIRIPIIKTFLKYDIDFSITLNQKKYTSFIMELEAKGLDKDLLLNYLFNYIETKLNSVSEWSLSECIH
jgi:ankyrin repeat protein